MIQTLTDRWQHCSPHTPLLVILVKPLRVAGPPVLVECIVTHFNEETGRVDKATNKLAQQVDRWGALEKLKEDGTEEALLGLCKRFGITSMKGVEDEQEKNWVVDTLVAASPRALPPLIRYMAKAEQLAFPLRVLERIAPREKVLEVADSLFASEPPGYVRMPERRIDLIRWFAEWKPATDDEVVGRLAPYVGDFDENSRFAAIDGMSGRDAAKIAPPLIAARYRFLMTPFSTL